MNRILNYIAATVGVLAFACTAFSQLKIDGQTKVVQVDRQVIVKEDVLVVQSVPFTVQAPAGGFLYSWDVPSGITAKKKGNALEVTAAAKGSVTISVEWVVIDFDKRATETKSASISFAVGDVGPGPKPPDPKPPDPSPAPIPVDGFRVLFIVETAANIPADQRAVLAAAEVRAYLNRKCADGPKVKEWRQWDQHTDVSGEAKHWQDAMKRKRDSLPWVIISNHPKGGYEGPMPKTISETLELLKRYGE